MNTTFVLEAATAYLLPVPPPPTSPPSSLPRCPRSYKDETRFGAIIVIVIVGRVCVRARLLELTRPFMHRSRFIRTCAGNGVRRLPPSLSPPKVLA